MVYRLRNPRKRLIFPPVTRQPWTLEDELLKNFRLFVLKVCGWNRTHAALIIGTTVRNIRLYIARYRKLGYKIPESSREPKVSEENLKRIYEWANPTDQEP